MTRPAGTAGTQPTIGDNRRSGNRAVLAAACTMAACAAIAVLVARRGADLGQAAPLVLAAASPRLVHSD
ncbi:MAG TPA: hypothetical protein VLH10_00690, partial [Yinghuangia sp.]|nr:hypothetical protein [Yinghuangia sp.]